VNLDSNAIVRTAGQATSFAALPKLRAARAQVWGGAAETALFWLLIGGLAWLPFWNGSNELIAWGINATLFGAIAGVFEILLLVRGARHPVGIRNIALPATLFALVVVWIYAQTLTSQYSPLTHPIWKMATDVLERQVDGSITVDRDLTNLALLRLITSATVFWISLQLCRNGIRANDLMKSISVIGCAYAAYGLVALSVPALRVPWLDAPDGVVSSTFVNRNSFGTYAGLALIPIVALTIRIFRDEVLKKAENGRMALLTHIDLAGRTGAVMIGAGFVVSVSLFLTGSRGGVAAAVLGIFVLGVLNSRRQKYPSPTTLIALAALCLGGLLFLFGDPLIANFAERGIGDVSRGSVYLLTLRSIFDLPLLGHGYGTFSDIFPLYRDRSISVYGRWAQAHNTYLEVFQGLGVVFGAMLVISIMLLIYRCIGAAEKRRENAMIPRITVAAAALLGVQAFVDFGLQIQAVTLTFAAMLGAGVGQAQSSRVSLQD